MKVRQSRTKYQEFRILKGGSTIWNLEKNIDRFSFISYKILLLSRYLASIMKVCFYSNTILILFLTLILNPKSKLGFINPKLIKIKHIFFKNKNIYRDL